jgi:hypothetical protein
MRRISFLIVFAGAVFNQLPAQSIEKENVIAVINKLFAGMYKGDSAMVRSVFATEVTSATVARDKDGKQVLRRESSIDEFVKAVGKPYPEPLTEEIWNIQVQIDGDLAQAWCDYAFYIGHRFSHCGADAFQLHKTTEGWKIFHLADTRRKDGCNIPEEIKKKHQ